MKPPAFSGNAVVISGLIAPELTPLFIDTFICTMICIMKYIHFFGMHSQLIK
jgi:hypothetical protein